MPSIPHSTLTNPCSHSSSPHPSCISFIPNDGGVSKILKFSLMAISKAPRMFSSPCHPSSCRHGCLSITDLLVVTPSPTILPQRKKPYSPSAFPNKIESRNCQPISGCTFVALLLDICHCTTPIFCLWGSTFHRTCMTCPPQPTCFDAPLVKGKVTHFPTCHFWSWDWSTHESVDNSCSEDSYSFLWLHVYIRIKTSSTVLHELGASSTAINFSWKHLVLPFFVWSHQFDHFANDGTFWPIKFVVWDLGPRATRPLPEAMSLHLLWT